MNDNAVTYHYKPAWICSGYRYKDPITPEDGVNKKILGLLDFASSIWDSIVLSFKDQARVHTPKVRATSQAMYWQSTTTTSRSHLRACGFVVVAPLCDE